MLALGEECAGEAREADCGVPARAAVEDALVVCET